MSMKKIVAGVLILAVVIGLGLGALAFQKNFVIIHGTVYPKVLSSFTISSDPVECIPQLKKMPNLERLDLRKSKLSVEQYQQLSQALPECRILWMIPFQGEYFSSDTVQLTVQALSPGDLDTLQYFTHLNSVDATACKDLDAVMMLKERYPQYLVDYTVELEGTNFSGQTKEITLTTGAYSVFEKAIKYLPLLENITVEALAEDAEGVYTLLSENPQIHCNWRFPLFGLSCSNDQTHLDLSGIVMESADAVNTALKYFDNLQEVAMHDCDVPNEQIAAMAEAYPQTKFVWTVSIGDIRLKTDVVTFMPYKFRREVNDEDCQNLIYCTDLECVDLGHMPVSTIDFLKNCTKMKYLLIGDTEVTDLSACANMPELLFLEMFMCHVEDLSPLVECKKLEDLNVGASHIGDVTPLCEMTWLKHLWAKRCFITWNERQQIKSALTETVLNFKAGTSSTADGWRELQNYYDMRDLLGMPYFSG